MGKYVEFEPDFGHGLLKNGTDTEGVLKYLFSNSLRLLVLYRTIFFYASNLPNKAVIARRHDEAICPVLAEILLKLSRNPAET